MALSPLTPLLEKLTTTVTPLLLLAKSTKMTQAIRITVSEALARLTPLLGHPHQLIKNKNKGNAGHYLETLLGIPHSSASLDCEDGELKAFPLKRLRNGTLAPKETVAVTMCCVESLKTQTFEESRLSKKLRSSIFVPYLRENDETVVYYNPILFTDTNPLWATIVLDYELLQSNAKEGWVTGKLGTFLQTRTKGAGHGSTSRAFYLRPQFIKALFADEFSVPAATLVLAEKEEEDESSPSDVACPELEEAMRYLVL